jgi:TrmH family RNA methyltransferase
MPITLPPERGSYRELHSRLEELDLITSAANPLVKRVRMLSEHRKVRRREGAFVVEGAAPVWRAVEADADIEVLLFSHDLVAGTAAQRLVAEAVARGIKVEDISADLFGRLSGKDGPAGVLAIVRGAGLALAQLAVPPDALVVGLHEVATPGNLGTIVRAADAAGASAVVTIGASTDPHSPAAVKASMGSLFAVPIGHAESLQEFFGWCVAHGLRIVTTSARATTAHWDADWSTPLAVLLGSEGDGLDADAIARGDEQVRIPMTGTVSSLNLAVAAGILLFETRRPCDPQRRPSSLGG